jgi:hypothetical protein
MWHLREIEAHFDARQSGQDGEIVGVAEMADAEYLPSYFA